MAHLLAAEIIHQTSEPKSVRPPTPTPSWAGQPEGTFDANVTVVGTPTANIGQSKANGVVAALGRLSALDLDSLAPPQAGNCLSPSTQRTLADSVGEPEEYVCETPDKVSDLRDALAGLDLEGGGSKGERLQHIQAQDLEIGSEEVSLTGSRDRSSATGLREN